MPYAKPTLTRRAAYVVATDADSTRIYWNSPRQLVLDPKAARHFLDANDAQLIADEMNALDTKGQTPWHVKEA